MALFENYSKKKQNYDVTTQRLQDPKSTNLW